MWLSLLVSLAVVSYAAGRCEKSFYLSPDMGDKFRSADVIMYGKDVTPREACGNPDECIRRQIKFEVYCIIKGDVRLTSDVITIGSRDTVKDCDQTTFPYNDRDQELIVVLKRGLRDMFEWDEDNGTGAKFTRNPKVLAVLNATCGVATHPNFLRPMAPGLCNSKLGDIHTPPCPNMCPPEWMTTEAGCYWVAGRQTMSTQNEAKSTCTALHGKLMRLARWEDYFRLRRLLPTGGPWWSSTTCDADRPCKQLTLLTDVGDQNDTMIQGEVGRREYKRTLVFNKQAVTAERSSPDTKHPYVCHRSLKSDITLRYKLASRYMGAVCCRSVVVRAMSGSVNTERVTVQAGALRDRPEVRLDLSRKGGNVTSRFTVALVVSPPDVAPRVHWLSINSKLESTTWGTLMFPEDEGIIYDQILPRTAHPVKAEFFIFRQNTGVVSNSTIASIVNLVDRNASCYRCDLDRVAISRQFNMTQVASLTLLVRPDEYSVSQLYFGKELTTGEACRTLWPDTRTAHGDRTVCEPKVLVAFGTSNHTQNAATATAPIGLGVVILLAVMLEMLLC